MVKRNSWLILAFFSISFLFQSVSAVELIISDKGRNIAWSSNLSIGDNFSIQGADTNQVGGIIPNSTVINQMLVPMPQDKELEQMSQEQEEIWINNLGKLLKDRVHIAISNDVSIFEIQLLQHTPQPSVSGMFWRKHPHTEGFAQMAYQAIGQLVEHLQERKEPVRLTAAVADTGTTAFALGIDNWKPYAGTFRRADLIDGHASLNEIRPVINTLGSKRVRLFRTTGIAKTPSMTIGRKEVTDNLLNSYPYLAEYVLTPENSIASGQYSQTPWISSLSGPGASSVMRRQAIDGEFNEQALEGKVSGLGFRDPVGGLDPENFDNQSDGDRMELGIVAPVSGGSIISSFPKISGYGARISKTEDGTVHYVRVQGLSPTGTHLPNRTIDVFSDYSKASGRQLTVANTIEEVHKITATGRDALYINHSLGRGGDISGHFKTFANNGVSNVNLVSVGFAATQDNISGLHYYSKNEHSVNSISFSINAIEPQRGGSLIGSKTDIKGLYHDMGRLTKEGKRVNVFVVRDSGNPFDKDNIKTPESYGINVIRSVPSHLINKNINPLGFDIPNPLERLMINPSKNRIWKDSRGDMTIGRKALGEMLLVSEPRDPVSFQTKSRNQHYTQIKIHPNNFSKLEPRLSRQTTIYTRGSFNVHQAFNDIRKNKPLKIKLDPLSIKTPQSNDLVIEPYKPLKLSGYEASHKLGEITRKSASYEFQKPMDDFPDLGRIGTTQPSFSNNYSMRSGFNNQLPLSQDIGGVMLNTSAKFEGGKSTLNTGNISLVFQNSAGVIDFMKLQSFSTALWATYLSVEGPGISIDPIEKKREQGNKHYVRHIGQVRNTELGKVMRETDYLMKRWAIGTHRPDIKSFLSPDDIDKKLGGKPSSNSASRFWFIPKGLTFKRSNNMLLFSSGQMTLQTEYLDDNPKGEKNPANELFAQWFTDNYDLVAQRYPIFKKLFEYAQLVSLSTYLRENKTPMLWFLMANRELTITENAIDYVDELTKKSGNRWNVKIYGGVELDLTKELRNENIYQTDYELQNAEDTINAGQTGINSPVVFSANDTSYTVSSKNILKLINSSADGDIIQTDLALVDQYDEQVSGGNKIDNKWNLIAPRLELVRYYNPKLQTRAQFGNGWHLLVPFRLETKQKTLLSPNDNQEQVVLVNLLSGIREVVFIDKCETAELKYRGEERDGLTKCLERSVNGSWELKDILGATYIFDQDGDLIKMTLREDKEIKYKLKSKMHTKNIPGYTVRYRYDMRNINGKKQKILTSIKQSNHTARIDWHPDDTKQIVGIRVLKQGRPVEALKYMYSNGHLLTKISSQSGQNISVSYQDDNQRVSVSR